MFVRKKYSKNTTKIAVQICSSKRIGGKVQQRILRHVGFAKDESELPKLMELAEYIKLNMEKEVSPSLFPDEYLVETVINARKKAMEEENAKKELLVNLKNLREESRIITGIHEVYGQIYKELGFNNIFSSRQQGSRTKLYHTVLGRISEPLSKRATVEKLGSEYGINMSLQSVYDMMDKLDDKKTDKIKDISTTAVRGILQEKVDVLFYDCTTLYFESFVQDGFKENGYSKDHKFNQSQVLLSLIVSSEGLPIGYEVYPGSQYEGHTVTDAIESIQKRYDVKRVIFVADSGMISQKNLKALEGKKINYILGARLKNMNDTIKSEILSIEKDDSKKFTVKEIALTDKRRLIVTYRPERARKDKHDREKWLAKLEEKLKKDKNPKSLLSNFGYKAILNVSANSEISIDEDKVKLLEKWDGLHGVVSNDDTLSYSEIINQYKLLWQIESCFRVSKHDLSIRPIYHWTERRIRAHIAICFIALVCVRILTYRTKLQYQSISSEEIRRELKRVQISILKDIKTDKKYCLPSYSSSTAKKLYHIVGLKLDDQPYQLK